MKECSGAGTFYSDDGVFKLVDRATPTYCVVAPLTYRFRWSRLRYWPGRWSMMIYANETLLSFKTWRWEPNAN